MQVRLASDLTTSLVDDSILSREQLSLGCTRLIDALPDLTLDNPAAGTLLADFIAACCGGEGKYLDGERWMAEVDRLRG